MAWSSCNETGEQIPTPPHHQSGSPSPGYGCEAGSGTFAEFLEQRRQYVPSVLLVPAACGHCGKLEDLRRGRNTDIAPQHWIPDEWLADQIANQIAFEGNSCFTCVKMIFEESQWIDEVNDRDTPLHHAARSGNLRMLFHLLCLLGDFYGHQWTALVLRKLNDRGETALHEAIRLESTYMTEMLMWVDPNLALHHGAHLPGSSTPLYLAVSLGYKHVAEILHKTSGGNLSYSGPDGQNALHATVHCPNGINMIQMLLDWNKDLSKEKDKKGSTPLHSVISARSEDDIDRIFFCFPNKWIPLEKSATWRVLDANPSAAYQYDNNGLLPVHVAALMDRKIAILVLLKRCGGCIYLRDKEKRSFLHIAVQNKVYRIVKYACQEPVFASILNSRDNDGNTALHLAVEVDDPLIFCRLLRNPKVLINLSNNKDQTPLDVAWSKKRRDFSYALNPENVIYRTLVRAGARHGSFWRDNVQDRWSTKKEVKVVKEDKKGSDEVNESSKALGILSLFIATATFGVALTVPAAVKQSDKTSSAIPRLFCKWYFNAFMATNTFAFFSSSLATILLVMFSGMSMVKLKLRWIYFHLSVLLVQNSITCFLVAFGLGVRTMMDPVGSEISRGILLMIILQLLFLNSGFLSELVFTYKPLSVRQGPIFVFLIFTWRTFVWALAQFWPIAFVYIRVT